MTNHTVLVCSNAVFPYTKYPMSHGSYWRRDQIVSRVGKKCEYYRARLCKNQEKKVKQLLSSKMSSEVAIRQMMNKVHTHTEETQSDRLILHSKAHLQSSISVMNDNKKRSYAPDDIFSRRLQLAFIGRHPIFVMGMRFVPCVP